MTIPEKREKLSAAIELQREIDRITDQLLDLRADDTDRIPDALLTELEEDLRRLEAQKSRRAESIRRHIEAMRLPERDKNLLLLRYVQCRPWKHVRIRLGLSETSVHRIENMLLRSLELS